MRDLDRKCMSVIILSIGFFAVVSCQMFDKKPTIYDHMKSGANTKKSNLIDSELKIEKVFVPDECTIDDDDFYGDRGAEIAEARHKLRLITAEEGDTVTLHFKITLEADGTVIEDCVKPSEELGGEDIITPAVFTLGYGHVIHGWELGLQNICVGEVRKLTIPPQLAYGSKGYKKKNIPPDATLEIETKLVWLKKKDMVDHYMDFLQSLHVYAFFILGLTFLLSGYYKSKIAEKRRLYREIEERKQRRLEMEAEEYEYDEEEETEVVEEEIGGKEEEKAQLEQGEQIKNDKIDGGERKEEEELEQQHEDQEIEVKEEKRKERRRIRKQD